MRRHPDTAEQRKLGNPLNAIALCGLGHHDEDLKLRTEAVVRWRLLTRLDPDQHEDTYQQERNRLAGHFAQHDHEPDAAWRAEEDLTHQLSLGTPPSKRAP